MVVDVGRYHFIVNCMFHTMVHRLRRTTDKPLCILRALLDTIVIRNTSSPSHIEVKHSKIFNEL